MNPEASYGRFRRLFVRRPVSKVEHPIVKRGSCSWEIIDEVENKKAEEIKRHNIERQMSIDLFQEISSLPKSPDVSKQYVLLLLFCLQTMISVSILDLIYGVLYFNPYPTDQLDPLKYGNLDNLGYSEKKYTDLEPPSWDRTFSWVLAGIVITACTLRYLIAFNCVETFVTLVSALGCSVAWKVHEVASTSDARVFL